ncbi:hypothetical protein MRX96_042393 [Rhipicephalus microplus]
MSSYSASTMSFVLDMAIQYCLFLPLDLWTKHAIRTRGSLAERQHIWRSEAQILAVLVRLLFGSRLEPKPCPGSGRFRGVCPLWFQCMECIGVAVDGGLRKVLPQQWKMEQAATVVLTTTRRVTIASLMLTAGFLQHLWRTLVRWRHELWEAYLHHSDTISVPAETRGSPPRIARRATFSGVVDRMEVTDRTSPER